VTVGSPGAIVDGRPAHHGALARLRRRGQRLMVSRSEQDEAELERKFLSHPGVTRANLVAVMSPTGGVGKTTCTFVLANLLTTHLKLRVIAVDANPEFGTLAQLASGRRPTEWRTDERFDGRERRSELGLAELLDDADHIKTVAELGPYVTRVSTGLHILAGRHVPEQAARLGPRRYGELVAMLACFYEVVLLDLAPGMVSPLAAFASRRADQVVLVTTPDRVASTTILDALQHLPRPDRITVAANRSSDIHGWLRTAIAIPHDEQLATMLASRTYTVGGLDPRTRGAIKRLGLAVADRLV
jgi:MinD-like ATPase involved in chromosome partitioning or flagellar assembly